jgi:hypothetical protein
MLDFVQPATPGLGGGGQIPSLGRVRSRAPGHSNVSAELGATGAAGIACRAFFLAQVRIIS